MAFICQKPQLIKLWFWSINPSFRWKTTQITEKIMPKMRKVFFIVPCKSSLSEYNFQLVWHDSKLFNAFKTLLTHLIKNDVWILWYMSQNPRSLQFQTQFIRLVSWQKCVILDWIIKHKNIKIINYFLWRLTGRHYFSYKVTKKHFFRRMMY